MFDSISKAKKSYLIRFDKINRVIYFKNEGKLAYYICLVNYLAYLGQINWVFLHCNITLLILLEFKKEILIYLT